MRIKISAFTALQIQSILLTLTVIAVSGCDNLFNRSHRQQPPLPEEFKLPSGERVRINTTDSGAAKSQGDNLRARHCVESICQVEKTFIYELEDKFFFLNAAERRDLPKGEQIFDAQLWPELVKVIDIERDDNLHTTRQIMNIIKRMPTDRLLNVDPITKKYIKFRISNKMLKKYKWDTHFDKEQSKKHNKLILKDFVLNALSNEERPLIEGALRIYKRSLTISNSFLIEKYGLRAHILKTYGSENFESSKRIFLDQVKAKLKLIEENFTFLYEAISKSSSLQKVLNGKDLLPVEEVDLDDILYNV